MTLRRIATETGIPRAKRIVREQAIGQPSDAASERGPEGIDSAGLGVLTKAGGALWDHGPREGRLSP